MELEELRFPTGTYTPPGEFTATYRNECIEAIAAIPQGIQMVTAGFTERAWHTPYREGGWTGVQVVHHMADSHMNAFCRFKLGVTEENPDIRSYQEKLWAQTQDSNILPPSASILILEGLHIRWVVLLKSLSAEEYKRTVFRTETGKTQNLEFMLGLYAWHGRHHLAHLRLINDDYK